MLWKLSGPDRAALYLVALGTRFRRNELRSLKPEAFVLDADPPTITVTAAYSEAASSATGTDPVALGYNNLTAQGHRARDGTGRNLSVSVTSDDVNSKSNLDV